MENVVGHYDGIYIYILEAKRKEQCASDQN